MTDGAYRELAALETRLATLAPGEVLWVVGSAKVCDRVYRVGWDGQRAVVEPELDRVGPKPLASYASRLVWEALGPLQNLVAGLELQELARQRGGGLERLYSND